MSERKTTNLKILEIQQKVIDVWSYYWKEILFTISFIFGLGYGLASFVKSISDNKTENKLRAEYEIKIEKIIEKEDKDCKEMINNYTKFVNSINPNINSKPLENSK